MESSEVKNILKAIGISSGIITTALVVGGVFYVYKTYLETQQIKLDIKLLKKELTDNSIEVLNIKL